MILLDFNDEVSRQIVAITTIGITDQFPQTVIRGIPFIATFFLLLFLFLFFISERVRASSVI
ncbi:hypothetical protein BDV25DRAFT_164775 [Aspergillus avenaceus]|uniref:Uncharacterized protein n=1 Tax=Aspergillus avenaceus TaxID=36643 RepID=A0A5N6TG82_ASPAV|nr:hypothetical protein BDV25DRAFT_164775 [Aspergillus avenaceus]